MVSLSLRIMQFTSRWDLYGIKSLTTRVGYDRHVYLPTNSSHLHGIDDDPNIECESDTRLLMHRGHVINASNAFFIAMFNQSIIIIRIIQPYHSDLDFVPFIKIQITIQRYANVAALH
jgi:hypothetical protein